MKEIRYDHHFNANEWSIVISLFVGALLVLILPKRFNKKTTYVYLMCGVFFGFLFDHTLGVLPVSYYVINDSSAFEWMDLLSHVMYGTVSYLFFYLYDCLKVKPRFSLLYILVWAFISIAAEKFCTLLGIFHYQHGYNIFYSFVIYFLVLSIWVPFFYLIKAHGEKKF